MCSAQRAQIIRGSQVNICPNMEFYMPADMINLRDVDPIALASTATVGGAFIWYARQLFTNWMRGRPVISIAEAVDKQIKMLQDQMEVLKAENKELRIAFQQLDAKLHRQQTKLTRTEMLLRQFVGLVKEYGVRVPDFMQIELTELLAPDSATFSEVRSNDSSH